MTSGPVTGLRRGILQRMVTLRSIRPISWRALSLFDYGKPPDLMLTGMQRGGFFSIMRIPFSGLLFPAAVWDEVGALARCRRGLAVQTIADAAISSAEAMVKS